MNDRAAGGRVVVCFAVPDESRLFAAARDPAVKTFHTGVGDTAAARQRLARLLAADPPAAVVSAGYAGGLSPALAVGDLVLGENHSSPPLLGKARRALAGVPLHVGTLLTVPAAVESAHTKAALHRDTGALAVDMETAWIAEVCAATGVPLLSLRVVSDAAGDDFPVPGRVLYDAVRQRPRYLALPVWLALHPGRIGPFARFVRGLRPARERLTRALRLVLAAR